MVADGDAEQSYSSANTNNLVEQPKMNFDEVFENLRPWNDNSV